MNEIRKDGPVGAPCGTVGLRPARRQAARAVTLWAGLTLGSVVVLAALAIWHLVRRGRLLRDGPGPARPKPSPLEELGQP